MTPRQEYKKLAKEIKAVFFTVELDYSGMGAKPNGIKRTSHIGVIHPEQARRIKEILDEVFQPAL